MEELKKLERLQRALSFMHSNSLSSSDLDSDRFLARFLLLLSEPPCGVLGIEKKYSLVLDFLKQINTEVLDKLNCFAFDEDKLDAITSEPQINIKTEQVRPNFTEMPLISFDAMQRSKSTLEDFCRSYFMFHDMDANRPESIFKFLPFLSFTESYIYQLDTSNENILQEGSNTRFYAEENHANIEEKIEERSLYSTYGSDPFLPLINIIQNHGLLTDRITVELKSGLEYWALEVKLCQALTRKEKISEKDVIRAINLKSFDYRVLNLLLYQLNGEQVNELHMEFLSLSEFLVEISDDLYDYEDDVMSNTFNILRMFMAVYGASFAPQMLAKCISDAEKKYEALLRKLDSKLSENYRKRCEQATREGDIYNMNGCGKWSIPPLILDEDAFRAQNAT